MKNKSILFALLFIFSFSISSYSIAMDFSAPISVPITLNPRRHDEARELNWDMRKAQFKDTFSSPTFLIGMSGIAGSICYSGDPWSIPFIASSVACIATLGACYCTKLKSNFCNKTIKKYLEKKFAGPYDRYSKDQAMWNLKCVSENTGCDLKQPIGHFMQQIEKENTSPQASTHIEDAKRCFKRNDTNRTMFTCLEHLLEANEISKKHKKAITMALVAERHKQPEPIINSIKNWMDKLAEEEENEASW